MTRMLNVCISDPTINPNAENLLQHAKDFLLNKMKMDNRMMDANVFVKKTGRPNTILLTFSDKRFKRFLYIARKNLRNSNVESCRELYINEDLTSYNFALLMKLKRERKRRIAQNLAGFESVYTFEGKVFVKRNKNEDNKEAIYIKSEKVLNSFLLSFEGEAQSSTNCNLASGSQY